MSAVKRSPAVTAATQQTSPTTRQDQRTRAPKSPTQKEKAIYFGIALYERDELGKPNSVEELQSGKTYTLVVTCDTRRSPMKSTLLQEKTVVAGAFSLSLSYTYSKSTTIAFPPREERSFEGVFEGEEEYELVIPADLPDGNVRISLGIAQAPRKYPSEITHYTLPVRGQQEDPIMEIFKMGQINHRIPEKTAILLVETVARHDEYTSTLRLRGWSRDGQQLDHQDAFDGIISIEELRKYRQEAYGHHLDPRATMDRLRHMSRHRSKELLNWLNELCRGYQEAFNLIIVDLTDKEIPWELLELKGGLYLGAYARVVRWLRVQYFDTQRELSIEPVRPEGTVLWHLANCFQPEQIADEQRVLTDFAGTSYPSLLALKKRLEDPLDDVGLIYIGCHGVEGRDLSSEGLQPFVPELASIMLEDMYYCQNPCLTVFINACEAGRTIKKSPDDRSNFVDTFLAYCASGFIGPLVAVDIKTASAIGGKLLQEARQPGGVHIAEQLRLLRKHEIMQLEALKKQDKATNEDYYRVLDTFMYVYYGNPLASVQIYPRKESQQ